jgi:hypothetical protein
MLMIHVPIPKVNVLLRGGDYPFLKNASATPLIVTNFDHIIVQSQLLKRIEKLYICHLIGIVD